ncbi:MAG: GNAT family N-acetyltransferase [Bacteroidetes bacterium]|nr:GNAT family N-acetyltransferase [Bacteroidota bacterium]
MNISIRRAEANELDLLESIEKSAFPAFQQSNRRQINWSLKSPSQEVWIADIIQNEKRISVGSIILHFHKNSLRLYSIGVLLQYQGMGVGDKMIEQVVNIANSKGVNYISLEMDAENDNLLQWYKHHGFVFVRQINDYYSKGRHAFKLVRNLTNNFDNNKLTNVIVVDNPQKWNLDIEEVEIMSTADYINNIDNIADKKARIFNLSNNYRYQSLGYYVSLLAAARDQRVIPTVTTIRDFRDLHLIRSVADDLDILIQKELAKCKAPVHSFNVYFGQTKDDCYKVLSKKLYLMFEAPLFQVHFTFVHDKWQIKKLKPLSLKEIEADDLEIVQNFAKEYFKTKRFSIAKLKNYTYCLAILVNLNETHPPSDRLALKRMKNAADECDVYCEFITKEDYNRLSEFDALFIRETTDVNNYTYLFSRKAYAEGLVVMDDPWSILRCSNKIFLYERLLHNNINTPKTVVLNKHSKLDKELVGIDFPLILKSPDGSFSIGVSKVNDRKELESSLKQLFEKSELILVQEFLPTDFDWRIGVLDNQPLYACKYYMAKNHWQILNWNSKSKDKEGDYATVPISEVPPKVLNNALKAASLMGDSLYGVDLKMIGDKVYVIEVNDNPNIDGGVEDKVLGDELYERIVKSFVTRIEMSRNIDRFVSVHPKS